MYSCYRLVNNNESTESSHNQNPPCLATMKPPQPNTTEAAPPHKEIVEEELIEACEESTQDASMYTRDGSEAIVVSGDALVPSAAGVAGGGKNSGEGDVVQMREDIRSNRLCMEELKLLVDNMRVVEEAVVVQKCRELLVEDFRKMTDEIRAKMGEMEKRLEKLEQKCGVWVRDSYSLWWAQWALLDF